MNIGPELRTYILALANAPSSTRGKNGVQIIIQPGATPPTYSESKGWTKWKNGRPRGYTRAEYKVVVGEQWLRRQFPAAFAIARLLNDVVDLRWHDLFQPTYKPTMRGSSLDEEEDAMLYSD